MRLIDADALIDSLNIRSVTYNCIINKCIEDAPTIDAVEVVRCKDCKYRNNGENLPICIIDAGDNDYCSYGEREDGEDK